jgi:hypothetical protein
MENPEAFFWTEESGMVGLGYLPGKSSSYAYSASADGSVVYGASGGEMFRWTGSAGMVGLGIPPGIPSGDASIIVGNVTTVSYGIAPMVCGV